MNLARLLRKTRADVIRILGDVVAQFFQLSPEFVLKRRHDGDRSLAGRRRMRRPLGGLRRGRFSPIEPRGHDRFFHFGGAADWASHQPALGLFVVSGRVLEPTLEGVVAFAFEGVADHSGPRTACRWVGSAMGSITSKRRPWRSDGICDRAAATCAGLMSARMTAGSVPPSARMRPHGSTTSECPNVSRPLWCRPPCAAAKTKAPFSIARARISTCQCASPVRLVNAEGTEKNEAPA